MAFADIGSLGAAGSTAADQATLVLTTTAVAAVGSLIVVVIAADNRGSVDTDDVSVSGVVDSAGNTYRKAHGYANAQTGAQLGASVALFYAEVTTQLASGGTITASFTTATSVDAAGMTARNFSYGSGNVIEVEATNWAATDAADPAALAATTANIECLRIRGIAGEVGNNTSLTPTASWTAWANGNSAVTGTTAEMCARAEHIISTTTSASSNPTWVSCDNASVYVAFKEVTPIAATDIEIIDVSTEASVASGFTLVCNAPAATPATDDILVVISGAARGDAVHSMDAAWTREVEISGSTSFSSLGVFWCRYAGSIPDRTITYTLTSLAKIAAMAIIRGCKTSGSPFNQVGADVQGTDNSLEHTGFTTTVDKCLIALINSTDDVSVDDTRVLVDGFTNVLEDTAGGIQNCYTTGSFDVSISLMVRDQGSQALVTTKTVHGANIGGWSAVMLAFEPAASSDQNITGALFSEADTFFTSVVTTSISITGALFSEADTFRAAIITASYSIGGGLFTDADTFFASTITPGVVSIGGGLFTDTDTFFASTVSPGVVSIIGATFIDPDTFYGAVISTTHSIGGNLFTDPDVFFGSTLTSTAFVTGALFTDPDIFFGANVQLMDQFLTGTLFTDPDTFFTSVVLSSYPITGALFTDPDVFFGSIVTTIVSITGNIFTDTDTFFAANITASNNITGALFADIDTFFSSVITADGAPQTIIGALFEDTDTFFASTITNDLQVIDGALFADVDIFFSASVSDAGSPPIGLSKYLFKTRNSFFGG